MLRAAAVLSLTPLFTGLLSGCFAQSSCGDFEGGTYTQTVVLTPAEYAQWASGNQPQPTTSDTGDTAADTTAADTTSAEVGTAADTTGAADTTTGEAGTTDTTGAATTGEPLSPQEVCQAVCLEQSLGGDIISCSVGEADADGNIPIECVLPQVCEGRGHACVRSRPVTTPTAAAWLARAAHDEAASVHAFNYLAAELALHGAPADLLARLHAAAADEVRHAAAVTALALAHAAAPIAIELQSTPPRDLLELSLENAREGCVHETWAALSAAHQARHARDPELRALYATIAADEARHAELAWALDAWLMGQLTPDQRALVDAARRTAARALQAALAAAPHDPELAALGLPAPATAAHLAAGLDAALWSQAA